MGTWGTLPWENDESADWFYDFFQGLNIDDKIEKGLTFREDNYDQIRAACYIIQILGRTYIWPGNLDKLDAFIEKGIDLLESMINLDNGNMDFLEIWENNLSIIESVQGQIKELKERRKERRLETKI